MNSPTKNIYNIPAGQPFVRVLAQSLLDETKSQKEQLSQTLILLPTRRACRILQDAFLDLRDQKPMLLPRMQPVGDLDEEELSLSILGQNDAPESWSLPPALPPLKRQILLAKLVQKMHPEHSQEQALKLAQALGHLMDQIYTENLNMADMAALAPEDFAQHWQITLGFLEILSEHWPKILKEEGAIDQADRRNRLILALADFWEKHPPCRRIIGAGSTGSIPSTARLLSVIGGLPRGAVILPGLDSALDQESWDALSETHPQFGFKQLLQRMDVPRENVALFNKAPSDSANTNRQILAREIMRPAETTGDWAKLGDNADIARSLDDLSLIACEHGREEADAIALLMRQSLTETRQTACLITPDRTLAARVSAACQRWSITVDDSAGQSLKTTPRGIFLRLSLETILENIAPLSLLCLLKHRLCSINIDPAAYAASLQNLDIALRGQKPAAGFEGLRGHIKAQGKLDEHVKTSALDLLNAVEKPFKALLDMRAKPAAFTAILKAHLELCETLAANGQADGAQNLWSGEEGRSAGAFFAEIFDHAARLEPMMLRDYAATLAHFMDQVQIRPAFGTHPRLQILGQLEARLIDADLVILGGLNEGVWPPDPAADPWMSRPMRKDFGLPSPERGTGLAAHDFVQGLCAPRVILTRALRAEGALTVPSRWVQRFDAVMQAAGLNLKQLEPAKILQWARMLDHAPNVTLAQRPSPCPPVEKRPRRLSVTQIETWLRDPYSIYARHVLGLRMLEPLEKPIDAALRGNLMHSILERFILQTREKLPENAAAFILDIAKEEIEKRHEDPHVWSFWWPRFTNTARWLETQEKAFRNDAQNIAVETRGEIEVETCGQPFKLVGIADRIDRYNDGSAAIIDYKSGGSFSKKAMQTGALPQLPLEALILQRSGFAETPACTANSLQYWVLSGGTGGKVTALDTDIEALTHQAGESLKLLIEAYDDPDMPYIALPRPEEAPRFNDYEHLARAKEWSIKSDTAETEAA